MPNVKDSLITSLNLRIDRAVGVLLLAFALSLSQIAIGQVPADSTDKCAKNLKIDEFLLPEDSAVAKRTFESFREALLTGNRDRVLSLISFPADFVLNGYGIKFATSHDFEEKYDQFFTSYLIGSVRNQKPEELLAGWDGVNLSNGSVTFTRGDDGDFRVSDIRPKREKTPDSIAEFLDHRLTCTPLVVEGRIIAYDWVTHKAPGFENIYVDHFIVDVTNVIGGTLPRKHIRVDFWGVSHLPEYNLPDEIFKPASTWRIYLRSANLPPENKEVCGSEVQETISAIDESGKEFDRHSAIKVLFGDETPTYAGLPCFEARRQSFSKLK